MADPANLKYTKDHEWIDVSGDRGKVGITDYAQKQLGDVVFVDLPAVGRTFAKGEIAGVVESVKAASDIYMPVSGEVVEVNDALKSKPESVNKDPYGSWLLVVKLSNASETGALLDAAKYGELVK